MSPSFRDKRDLTDCIRSWLETDGALKLGNLKRTE